MTERLREALERLEAALAQVGHPVVRGLRPGRPAEEVQARLAEIDVDPPEDVITFFGWHDGYETPSGDVWQGRISPSYRPFSLDEACDEHASHQDVLKAAAEYTGEQSQWFAILEADGAWCVVNYGCSSNTRGQVAAWDGGELTPAPEHRPSSLAEPIELWVSYLEAGHWRWDGSRWIDNRTAAERAEHPWSI
jgi:hypothetical protein